MNNHDYVEASYILLNLKAQLAKSVVDETAMRSIVHRIDNLQSFLDYLNDEGLG